MRIDRFSDRQEVTRNASALIDLYAIGSIGRGGGDRKQQLEEFQGLTRNA
jgi:hypothetical protein